MNFGAVILSDLPSQICNAEICAAVREALVEIPMSPLLTLPDPVRLANSAGRADIQGITT